MKMQLPTTEYVSIEQAFHYLGNLQFGSEWSGNVTKRSASVLSQRRIVESGILEALQLSNMKFVVEGEDILTPEQIRLLRVDSGCAITDDERLVAIKIDRRSLIGHAREWGLIDGLERQGRPTKIDWAEIVFYAWEYALLHKGKFGDEEMRCAMRDKADSIPITRPTPSTLDRWSTRIREAFDTQSNAKPKV